MCQAQVVPNKICTLCRPGATYYVLGLGRFRSSFSQSKDYWEGGYNALLAVDFEFLFTNLLESLALIRFFTQPQGEDVPFHGKRRAFGQTLRCDLNLQLLKYSDYRRIVVFID